jgi:hypothetical protein
VKKKYEKDIVLLHKAFINKLRLLPVFGKFSFFLLLLFAFSFMFFAPLYTFKYWIESGVVSSIFLGLVSVMASVVWFFLRNKIKKKYSLITYKNQELYNAFSLYVQSLKSLAVNIRKSTLRRKNIDELTKVYDVFKKEESQLANYIKFYSKIITQLHNNGYQITESEQISRKANYQTAPFLDYRVPTNVNRTSFSIKQGSSIRNFPEETNYFITILGIIKSIEFN